MKVKNIMFSGFAAAILMGVAAEANAAPKVVASKGYVDAITGRLTALEGAAADKDNLVQAVNVKQDKLTAGANIEINDNTISATGLQTALTPGDNIDIVDGVISATDTTYEGEGYITVEDGKIKTTLKEGTNVTIGADGSINATDTTYEGEGYITVEDGKIKTTLKEGTNVTIGADGSINATGLQKTLTPGNFINISDDGTISTKYQSGTNITIGTDGSINTTFPAMPSACRTAGVVCVLTSENGTLEWAVLTQPYTYTQGTLTDVDRIAASGWVAQQQSVPAAE